MRFLDTRTGQFVVRDPEKTRYAILSHTWRTWEQTYGELKIVQARYGGPAGTGYASPPASPSSQSHTVPTETDLSIWDDSELSRKIRDACRVAREAGYDYLWIDSCCIDKSSSSELTESINSMYKWYGDATECYAYLADVPPGEDPRSPKSSFRSSRWFERGWTLQELVSPSEVKFLSNDWNIIGTKHILVDLISEITGIPDEALLHEKSLDEFSVAQRLSWAANRTTTRVEDRAYSLLGIFDINMSTLYGEGERAFRRLQEEILRRIPDQSLFAWQDVYQGPDMSEQPIADQAECTLRCLEWSPSVLLASSMNDFSADSRDIQIVPHAVLDRLQLSSLSTIEYTPSPQGIRTQIPLLPLSRYFPQSATIAYPDGIPRSQWYLAILGCEHKSRPGSLLGRVCYIPPSGTGIDLLCSGCVVVSPAPSRSDDQPDLFPLSSATIERCREHITLKTVYISHPERASTQSDTRDPRYQPHKTINLLLRRKTGDALRAQGYTAGFRGPDEDHPTTHWLTLSCDDHTITVEYRHTLEYHGRRLTVEADVKMSRPALDAAGEIEADPRSVKWWGYAPWNKLLDRTQEITFTLATKKLAVKLSLDWAALSHYSLRVDIVTEALLVESSPSLQLAQGTDASGSGAGGEADIGAEAGTSEGGVLQPDGDALLPRQYSDGPPSPLEAREGEEHGAGTKVGEEVEVEREGCVWG
ncbi:HET-domain-containing protein [Dichomitus squalens LYAD-421 SS1]|uniref:HET-domain-containing protein n=2 Tax=Dichomitus squalens TaxID=114155 RepID=A0A4Q9PU26_9APHY|nr:HET-domain-containing protein [Dichomitus squalens LYAD-421 SS1]EJF59924.1 HET-domain-containing protein [Dichomitus squalens LYAD-421 SS1]TBU57939.1 HET-domain-containing protein [Dichomitus squalens]